MGFDFAALWDSGMWRKIGRREAASRFHRQVKTEKDWLSIQAARDAYNAYCFENRRWYHPVHGAVWFGTRKGWREWIPDEMEVNVKAEQTIPILGTEHHHVCEFCEADHEWLCQDELCTLGPKVACPIIRGKYKASK